MFGTTAMRSAFRGMRTNAAAPRTPEPSSPTGADDSTTVPDEYERQRADAQARALREMRERSGVWGMLPGSDREQGEAASAIQGAYGTGGFDGVKNTEGWFDMPAHVRTALLSSMVAGRG